jgi:glycerol-3-phosphate acyltransferase PlsY
MRTAGLWAGLAVFVLDGLKGYLAVHLMAPWFIEPVTAEARLGCGVAAVIGHDFPIFLKFRGGKGVATTIGALLAAMPGIAIGGLIVWAASFLLCRYVSVSSLALALAVPLLQWRAHHSAGQWLLGLALALLMAIRHRSNIERLLHGTEHRAFRR